MRLYNKLIKMNGNFDSFTEGGYITNDKNICKYVGSAPDGIFVRELYFWERFYYWLTKKLEIIWHKKKKIVTNYYRSF